MKIMWYTIFTEVPKIIIAYHNQNVTSNYHCSMQLFGWKYAKNSTAFENINFIYKNWEREKKETNFYKMAN